MDINRLTGRRFFAVVKKAFVACPGCSKVHRLTTSKEAMGKGWSPRLQRLRCGACGGAWYIGVLAWPSKSGGGNRGAVPFDNVANREEAEELERLRQEELKIGRERRAQYRNVEVRGVKRRKGAGVNIVVKGEEGEK